MAASSCSTTATDSAGPASVTPSWRTPRDRDPACRGDDRVRRNIRLPGAPADPVPGQPDPGRGADVQSRALRPQFAAGEVPGDGRPLPPFRVGARGAARV